MVVIEDGIVSDVKAFNSKAPVPMVVIELGIVSDVNAICAKAPGPMPVTVTPLPLSDGIVRDMPLHEVAQPVTVAPSPEKLNPPV